MKDLFAIEFPEATSPDTLQQIQADLARIREVIEVGPMEGRTAVIIRVKLISEIAAAIGAAVPVLQKIMNIIRLKGIRGARIVFLDGSAIAVDEASIDDLTTLIEAEARSISHH